MGKERNRSRGRKNAPLDWGQEDSEFLRAMGRLASAPDKDSGSELGSQRSTAGRSPGRKERSIDRARLETLDLHGVDAEQAIRRLDSFVQRTRASGRREVLVITGKGRRSAGGVPVIKQTVLRWLRGPGKARVERFEEAHSRLGGSGALLLSLKPLGRQAGR